MFGLLDVEALVFRSLFDVINLCVQIRVEGWSAAVRGFAHIGFNEDPQDREKQQDHSTPDEGEAEEFADTYDKEDDDKSDEVIAQDVDPFERRCLASGIREVLTGTVCEKTVCLS